ncbi:unnamed protein product [Leptidea sinapis]|uniref:Large ribosomal subunit protein eL14 domain-containing protein n=1 Tax=Leptidea sinapis TaxID=189913 RepID=A0A5E4QYG1_9NEOP|nr:unnamed protein product [Leptidea sinapis]
MIGPHRKTQSQVLYPFTAPTRVVRKDEKLNEKWEHSQWAQKLANKVKRATMTDYDRFKLQSARVKRNRARAVVFKSMKDTAARAGTFGKRVVPKKTPATKKPAKK